MKEEKNLEVRGLVSLTEEEVTTTNGGVLPALVWLASAFIGGIVHDIVTNPRNTSKQFMDGYNSVAHK